MKRSTAAAILALGVSQLAIVQAHAQTAVTPSGQPVASGQSATDQAQPTVTAPATAATKDDAVTPAGADAVAAQQDAVADAAAPAADAGGDIVVTGSRVVRDGSQAPTPVTVVAADTLARTSPTNIPDALNKLPVFANSATPANGSTFQATGRPTGNYLNLRSLGTDRVLVLLNGSRVPPTATGNAVDTNVIPNLLVSRVDVVTGGASAAYGSDAVTGVVNFVLDERFTGLKAQIQDGVSDEGDNFNYRLGVAYGTQVGERGHLIASYEHFKSDGIPSLANRDWAYLAPITTGAGTAANPFREIPNATSNELAYGGAILTGTLSRSQFNPDGTLTAFRRGTPTGSNNRDQGGDGAVFGRGQTVAMIAKLQTDQAFLRSTYDITDSIQFYAQGVYARSETSGNTTISTNVPGSNRAITIFADNPYLRPELAARLRAANQASFVLGRAFDDIPAMTQRTTTEFFTGMFGLKGGIAGSWKWDANYVNGRSILNLRSSEFESRRFFAAIDAVRDPATNQVVCGVTLRNPGLLPGCVPINVIGEGNITQAAYNYVRQDSRYRVENHLQYGNVNFQGDLFSLPAGAVSLAFGGEYRRQTLEQTSNADPAAFSGAAGAALRASYFQGIRGVPSNALIFTTTNVGQARGTQTIKEGYAELLVPLLKDTFLAQNLELNLAGRITDYRTSGSVETYKIGASWVPVDGLRLRGTYSRDIAAPSLYSLFAGANVANLGLADPLTGVTSLTQVVTSGNAALRPEFGKTKTVGVVFTPRFLPGFTLSVDAYDIRIKGAIQTTTAESQLATCQASGGTAPSCALIIRPFPYSNTTAANYPTQIFVVPQNLAELQTRGIDFEVGYTTNLDGWLPSVGGTLSLRAFANYLDRYDTQDAFNLPVLHRAGRLLGGTGADFAGLPKWKGLLTQTYVRDRFTINFNERFTGSYDRFTTQVYADPNFAHSPNRTYVDTSVSYDVLDRDRAQVFFNVQNLFDVDPPIRNYTTAPNLGTPTDKGLYDIVGRQFTAGFRFRF